MKPTYLKTDLKIHYGNNCVMGSELMDLKPSELIEIMTQLQLDITSIRMQLKQAESEGAKDDRWMSKAGHALMLKGVQIYTIKQIITLKNQLERERIRDTSEIFRQVAKELLPPALFSEIDRLATERSSRSQKPKLVGKNNTYQPISQGAANLPFKKKKRPTKNPQAG